MKDYDRYPDEDRAAEELADKLADASVGYSYQVVQYAISRLNERLHLESVFTGERVANRSSARLDATAPISPSE